LKKISIITVTYNSAATLEETILSVISQDYAHIEYIIVDGESSDGTMQIAEKYKSSISRIIREKDKGLYDAVNKGIDAASGDIVGILHSDDFYTSTSVISSYVKVFEEQDCDAVYADLYYVDRNNTSKIVRTWKSGKYQKGSFLDGWMPPHPTFFVKRQVYEKYGKFSLELKSAADYEFMLRVIHKNQISLQYLPQFTVKMRAGGKSNESLKNRVNANLEDRKAWEMNGLQPRFYTLYLKPLRKLMQFLRSQ
jgi:glycosyltransferase